MNLDELTEQVLSLPEEDRRAFAAWFYEHEGEFRSGVADEDWGLSPEQEDELARRLEEIDEHPELLVPWEGTIEALREELHAPESHANSAR